MFARCLDGSRSHKEEKLKLLDLSGSLSHTAAHTAAHTNPLVHSPVDVFLFNVLQDLGKAVAFEIIGSEINIPLTELDETMRHLKRWLKPEEVTTNLVAIPATSSVVREPTGTVLIIRQEDRLR